jgi:hypothetical protein
VPKVAPSSSQRHPSSFVVAAYDQVRLTPYDLRALPAELFTKPSIKEHNQKWFASGEAISKDILL